MGVKLADLLAEKATVDIQIGASKLGITFYVLWRKRFSDDEWAAVTALKGREYVRAFLPKVMLAWDLVDDDGHAVPVTAEAMDQHQIPDELLFACEQRIGRSDLAGKVISAT